MSYCSFSNFSLSLKEGVIHLARVNSEKQIQDCICSFIPNAGHFSIFYIATKPPSDHKDATAQLLPSRSLPHAGGCRGAQMATNLVVSQAKTIQVSG